MGRITVVTGGANGIGRCITELFASKGDTVYFIDADRAATETQTGRMRKLGWNVSGYTGDVAEKEELDKFAAMVLSRHPEGIHCLINNACVMNGGLLGGCSYDDFMYVQRVGVAAPFWLASLFKDHFQGLGSIVNISSTRAFQSQADTESYTAAKGGITALTHAMAVSLAGVARVNSISPGWIDTGAWHSDSYQPHYSHGDTAQHPSRRVGEPGDIARVAEFLCDTRNSFINGENVTVDGGMSRLMVYHDDCGWTFDDGHGSRSDTSTH